MRWPGHREASVEAMNAAPRCGARTRRGTACRAPAIRGRERCRMHGGRGSSAPRGNTNAFKHGCESRAERQRRKAINRLVREAETLLRRLG